MVKTDVRTPPPKPNLNKKTEILCLVFYSVNMK